ncbi:hypothetical protein ACQ859_03390 [Roseateles chitinivorans]|uniref:hypothetical protein n=1 Tax=Roseateles chitinivorans TaxID=2917965 RepID=UPI0026303F4E|nr:hypothetical protein [uncultured Roseateles sp.]
MPQENFHASVQYDDLRGSAAADKHDHVDMARFLKNQKLIDDGETLVGIEMFSGEVHTPEQAKAVYVTAYAAKLNGYDTFRAAVDSGNSLEVRKINLEMTLSQFFGLFKRFSICISPDGLLERKEIHFPS